MKIRMFSAVSAAALSLSLLGGAAYAQDLGLKQLQDSATAAMAQLNLDTSMVDALTLDELAQIQAITSSGVTDTAKADQIDVVLTDAHARIAAGGAVVPTGPTGDVTNEDLAGDRVVAANVGAYIAQLGMADEVDVDSLTTDQLLQIQLVQQSSEGEAAQKARIEQLLMD